MAAAASRLSAPAAPDHQTSELKITFQSPSHLKPTTISSTTDGPLERASGFWNMRHSPAGLRTHTRSLGFSGYTAMQQAGNLSSRHLSSTILYNLVHRAATSLFVLLIKRSEG